MRHQDTVCQEFEVLDVQLLGGQVHVPRSKCRAVGTAVGRKYYTEKPKEIERQKLLQVGAGRGLVGRCCTKVIKRYVRGCRMERLDRNRV
jgi:hypothetical protein